MTSWISQPLPKKRIVSEPVSLFPLNQGTFQEKQTVATIVTALYNIPNRIPFQQRKLSLKQFLTETTCQTVVFTDSSLATELADCCKTTARIVVLEKSKWISVNRYIPALWTQQVKQDPELSLNRTAEEFQYGYEKKEFVLKAIEMNPFKSNDFIWIDNVTIQNVSTSKIPTDRMLVANPEPFTADDLASSYFKGKKRVNNQILAGSQQQWKEFAKLYDVVMNMKLKVSQFIGDDLLMLHYIVIHKPSQFCLVKQDSLLSYF